MHTSQFWFNHFSENLKNERVDWNHVPTLSLTQKQTILKSLQAWQLGETSEGKHLLHASQKYAAKIKDPVYVEAVKLFIKEEQKHGNNLGKYLDLIGERRIKKDWGDSLFRTIRYYNTNMEIWTLAVITVESTAQIFYQSLKDATRCKLMKQICTDILIDEAYHIDFQLERMLIICNHKSMLNKFISYYFYKIFYFTTIAVVYFAHRKVFKAGGNNFINYWRKMTLKFHKTLTKTKKRIPLSLIKNNDVSYA